MARPRPEHSSFVFFAVAIGWIGFVFFEVAIGWIGSDINPFLAGVGYCVFQATLICLVADSLLGLGHMVAIVLVFLLIRSFFSLLFASFLFWILGASLLCDEKHRTKILFRGFIGFVGNLILFFAASRASSRFLVLALITSSLWVMLLSWLFLGEKTEPWPHVPILLFIGNACSFGLVFWSARLDHLDALGVVLAFLYALFFSVGNVAIRAIFVKEKDKVSSSETMEDPVEENKNVIGEHHATETTENSASTVMDLDLLGEDPESVSSARLLSSSSIYAAQEDYMRTTRRRLDEDQHRSEDTSTSSDMLLAGPCASPVNNSELDEEDHATGGPLARAGDPIAPDEVGVAAPRATPEVVQVVVGNSFVQFICSLVVAFIVAPFGIWVFPAMADFVGGRGITSMGSKQNSIAISPFFGAMLCGLCNVCAGNLRTSGYGSKGQGAVVAGLNVAVLILAVFLVRAWVTRQASDIGVVIGAAGIVFFNCYTSYLSWRHFTLAPDFAEEEAVGPREAEAGGRAVS